MKPSPLPTVPPQQSALSEPRAAPGQIPIFVINLARDQRRLEGIAGTLAKLGLDYERIAACDGPVVAPRLRRLRRREFVAPRLHRALTPGEVGCTLSHVWALRRVVARKLRHAIIFEDDVAFTGEFATLVREDLPQLLEHVDVIKLEGIRDHRSSRTGLQLAQTGAGELFVPLRPALGSAGYAINARGARQLLKAFKRLDRPLDHQLAAYDQHGAVYAEFHRFPVYQIGECSNIKAERQVAAVLRRNWTSPFWAKARVLVTAVRRVTRISLVLWQRTRPGRWIAPPALDRRPARE